MLTLPGVTFLAALSGDAIIKGLTAAAIGFAGRHRRTGSDLGWLGFYGLFDHMLHVAVSAGRAFPLAGVSAERLSFSRIQPTLSRPFCEW